MTRHETDGCISDEARSIVCRRAYGAVSASGANGARAPNLQVLSLELSLISQRRVRCATFTLLRTAFRAVTKKIRSIFFSALLLGTNSLG